MKKSRIRQEVGFSIIGLSSLAPKARLKKNIKLAIDAPSANKNLSIPMNC